MIQGDICLHTFKSPDKRRPVLLLTRTKAIPELVWVTVAPITTTLRNISSEVWLDEEDAMSQACAVNLDNIQTVQNEKLGPVIAHLSLERMAEVREAIDFALDLSASGNSNLE